MGCVAVRTTRRRQAYKGALSDPRQSCQQHGCQDVVLFRGCPESLARSPNALLRDRLRFFTSRPILGIDLDKCLDADGRLKPCAQPIMERFADSYAEISPSGRGIKIWA